MGLRWQPPGYASFVQAAAFQNTLTVNPAAPQFQVQTGEVRVRGAELEAVARLPGRGLNLIGSFTYLDPEITSSNRASEEGTRLAGVPKTTASLYLDKSFDEGAGALAALGAGAAPASATSATPRPRAAARTKWCRRRPWWTPRSATISGGSDPPPAARSSR